MTRLLPPLLLATLLGACATTHLIDTSSEAAFTDSASRMAAPLAGERPVTPAEPLVLHVGDGAEPWRIHLGEAWQFCETDADSCDEGVKRYLKQALERIHAREPGSVTP